MNATCCRCQQPTDEADRVLVGVPFSNSGAGGPASYACLPCARIYTRMAGAPDWLGDEIAKTRVRQASGRGNDSPP